MASFIPNVTDDSRSLSTSLGSPDFGFLQQNLYRSNQQYQEGLSQVKNDYSSVLSSPVTGQQAQERKDQYVQQVQQGLKKIAKIDVSLPQNVQQAENLYAPFWQDKDLLTNIGLTKQYQAENQTLDSWEHSTDLAVRSQYNAYSRADVQNGMQQLANAPLSATAYNRLQRRSATPFYNIDADVDEQWQKEEGTGKGIDTVTTDGFGAMITEHNGIKSKDAYKTYYLSKMATGKYDPQIAVIARVQNEQAKKEILQNNPGMTDQQVNSQFAQEYMGRLAKSYKENGNTYTDLAVAMEKKLKEVTDQVNNNQKGISDNIQKGYIQQYTAKAAEYRDEAGKQYKKYWNDYSPLTINKDPNPDYYRNLQDLTEHANDHIGHLQKYYMAEEWAEGRASISSQKKELDPQWKEYQDIAWHRDQIAAEREKTAATLRGQTLGYEESTGRDMRGNPLPGFNPLSEHGWYGKNYGAVSGQDAVPGRVVSLNTIEPGHISDPVQLMTSVLHDKELTVANNYYNPSKDGIANIILSQLGFGLSDITKFTESAKNGMNGINPTDEQAIIYKNVLKSMKDHGVDVSNVTGPRGLMIAMDTYAGSVVDQLVNSHNQNDNSKAGTLALALSNAHTARDTYTSSQKNFDDALHQELRSNPIYHTIINPHTGTEYTAADMAVDFPSVTVRTPNGATRTLSPIQVAELHRKGKQIEDAGDIQAINGKPISHYQDRDGYDHIVYHTEDGRGGGSLDNLQHYMNQKYGIPEINSALRKQATAKVIPQLNEFKNGILAKEMQFDPNSDNEKESKFAQNLMSELSQPGNTEGRAYYYKPGTHEKQYLKSEDESMLRNMLTSDPKKLGPAGATLGDEGSIVYPIYVKPSISDDKSPLAGKTIYLKESPNAQGPTMKSIPQNSGSYIYSNILDGGSYKADPIMQKLGINWTWIGYDKNSLGQATKSNIEIQRTIQDHKNPYKKVNLPTTQTTINHTGPDAKTVDEVGDAIKRQELNHIVQNNQNNKNAYLNITQ